jgi:RimJ/RimL family protein N-acetyltransferase
MGNEPTEPSPWLAEATAMRYNQEIILKNETRAYLRNADASDGLSVYENFNLTHAETDYLLSYPDENSLDPEQEARFLKEKTESPNEIEIIALVNGKVAGTARIEAVGHKHKVKHRAEFGISILREYWGIGLGKALTKACIQCARDAGYVQLELNVVAGNERAISLYRDMGFVEFGRNPRGFNSRESGFQELVYMLLRL